MVCATVFNVLVVLLLCDNDIYVHATNRENIAYGKPTTGTTTLLPGGSALGVDGSYNRDTNCAYSGRPRDTNWWQVDLGRDYTIKWLVYYNDPAYGCISTSGRHESCLLLMRGFRVYVSTTSTSSVTPPPEAQLCYQQTDETLNLGSASKYIIECGTDLIGRYVLFTLTVPNARMAICEVEIFQCEDKYFGMGCSSRCHCNDAADVCNKVTGACTSGCQPGYTGNCQTECDDGTYGPGCSNTCHCVRPSECNKETGSCSWAGGCADGYVSGRGKADCQDAGTCEGKDGKMHYVYNVAEFREISPLPDGRQYPDSRKCLCVVDEGGCVSWRCMEEGDCLLDEKYGQQHTMILRDGQVVRDCTCDGGSLVCGQLGEPAAPISVSGGGGGGGGGGGDSS